MTAALTWTTPAGSIGTFSEGAIVNQTFVAQPSQMATTLVYTLLNGSFASGETSPLALSTGGILTGTLAAVNQDTTSTFTIRCQEYLGSSLVGLGDRTFSMLVQGPDAPSFTLPSGSSLFNSADSTWIDYQVQYTANDPDVICIITLDSGELPLGLEMNESGIIRGYATPPVDSSDLPINQTYSFTLKLSSVSGEVTANYTATITNQELLFGYTGRAPAIYNVETPQFVMPVSDSYYGYYLSSYNIGSFTHDNNFIFKIIGHDFDNAVLNYVISIPPELGLTADTNTVTVAVEKTVASNSTVVAETTNGLIKNQEISFASAIGGLSPSPVKYYISNIISAIEFTVSASQYGPTLSLLDDVLTTSASQTLYNGWISGTLPNIGTDINTYLITASTYCAETPSLTSDTITFSITVVGDVNPVITWNTDPNLGLIVNGEISTKVVDAINLYTTTLSIVSTNATTDQIKVTDTSRIQTNGEVVFAADIGGLTAGVVYYVINVVDSTDFTVSDTLGGSILPLTTEILSTTAAYVFNTPLAYRVVGETVSFDLRTITNTASDFYAFGAYNYVALGNVTADEWSTGNSVNAVAFNSCFYDGVEIVCVGNNRNLEPKIYTTTDGVAYTARTVNATYPLWFVIKPSSTYIAVGEHGTIVATTNIASTWQPRTTGITADLFSIAYGASTYVAVGNNVIIRSADTVTWTLVPSFPESLIFRGICWTGTNFIAVGDYGVIATSPNAITWSYSLVTEHDLMAVACHSGVVIAVGHEGTILISLDFGITWQQEVSATLNDLYSVYYDATTTNNWYATGEGGTILTRTTPIWTSPTLGQTPPNLVLQHNGELVGRLAFESTDSVIAQGTEATYEFTIQAFSGVYAELNATRKFTLKTYQEFDIPYDNLYIKALTSLSDREKLTYILNSSLIPDEYVYRLNDPYFGRASSIVYQHMFGVPTVATSAYLNAVDINHYFKNITLGELKTAIARDVDQNILYEVVYSEIIDDNSNSTKLVNWQYLATLSLNQEYINSLNTNGVFAGYINPMARTVTATASASTVITVNSVDGLVIDMLVSGNTVSGSPIITAIHQSSNPSDACTVTVSAAQTLANGDQLFFQDTAWSETRTAHLYYPNSLVDMRAQITEAIGKINNPLTLPLWMRSQQLDGNIPGYTPAWIICYTKPGYSTTVKNNIDSYMAANPEYMLNMINFQSDRFERDQSMTYNYDTSTLTWDTLPSAQPPVTNDSQNNYVYFPRKTILPTQGQ